jgi:hypothetical protein
MRVSCSTRGCKASTTCAGSYLYGRNATHVEAVLRPRVPHNSLRRHLETTKHALHSTLCFVDPRSKVLWYGQLSVAYLDADALTSHARSATTAWSVQAAKPCVCVCACSESVTLNADVIAIMVCVQQSAQSLLPVLAHSSHVLQHGLLY